VGVSHLLDILVLWRHCLALVTATALIVYLAFDERCNGLLIGFAPWESLFRLRMHMSKVAGNAGGDSVMSDRVRWYFRLWADSVN
jgi:hypothetical protein